MSNAPPVGDVAAVSVFVAVPPSVAFEVFTAETDLWWRHGPKFRVAGRRRGTLAFEPGVGGRLFETFDDERGGSRTVQVGTIIAWEPEAPDGSATLAFEWRGVNFAPDQKTQVTVTFSPSGEGTMVRVCHAGWSTLPADHPVRHGLAPVAFVRSMGLWWADLARSYREHTATTRGQAAVEAAAGDAEPS